MNNNTIVELKKMLFEMIDELTELEPYWKKCLCCKNHGKCCVNADISIREDEWEIIVDFLKDINQEDRLLLQYNIKNNIYCPFHTSDKCIIHDVRPMNCIWTPYQLVQNVHTGTITYSQIDDECNFILKNQNIDSIDVSKKFVGVRYKDSVRYYLFLNDFFINYEHSSFKYISLSKLIKSQK